MSISLSFHSTKSISAEFTPSETGNDWVDLTITDTCGREFEITIFCHRKGDAQIYADAVNQAHAVVEPPDADTIPEAAQRESRQ